MEKYETADEVEAYMLKKLSFSDDISAKGVREEEIEKAMPKINVIQLSPLAHSSQTPEEKK
jgi:hypothetical protein